jgi:hypothetical protein
MTMELTASVRLSEIPEIRFMVSVLGHTQSARFLGLDAKGFMLLCRVPGGELVEFRRSLKLGAPHRIRAKVVNTEKTGVRVVQVNGLWSYRPRRQFITDQVSSRFVELMRRSIFHDISRLRISGETLVASAVGEDSDVEKLVAEIRHFGSAVRIVRIGRPRGLGTDPLQDLTARQRGTIQLAHAMGYYDIPRKANTEEIARTLGMDKGTVGEHLRRAEKHLIDRLFLPRMSAGPDKGLGRRKEGLAT